MAGRADFLKSQHDRLLCLRAGVKFPVIFLVHFRSCFGILYKWLENKDFYSEMKFFIDRLMLLVI